MNKETENKSNINIDREKKKKVRLNKDNFIKIVFHIFRQFDDQYYAGFAAQGCVITSSWPAFQHS